MAIDPSDPDHIVAGNAVWEREPTTGLRTSWLESHVSFDGGRTWRTTRLPGGPLAGPQHPLFSATMMGDAMVAFLPDGAPLFAGLALNHVGTGARDTGAFARTAYTLFVARSSDDGLSWSEIAIVREGRGVLAAAIAPPATSPYGTGAGALWDANDKEWMAVAGDGTVLLVWGDIHVIDPPEEPLARTDLLASVSKDGGRTWSPPVVVDQGGNYLGASPAIGSDGSFYVAYIDIETLELRLARSDDEGATWTASRIGESAFFPSLATIPRAGASDRLLVGLSTFERKVGSHALEQEDAPEPPALSWSDDGGATWTEPIPLDAPEGPGRTVPMIAVRPDGLAYVSFAHPIGAGENATTEYRAVAFREGLVSPPTVLQPGIRSASKWLGDYAGISATADQAFAVWVSSSDGIEFDLWGARLAS